MYRFLRFAPLALAGTLAVNSAAAAVFPDVPDGHVFQESIEQLHETGVINGNPDGTFAPSRSVNRAEMLKMLYIAAGHTPDHSSTRCFPDVVFGSWYESYVCDAAARKYVGGYPDGSFKPGQVVNRVEALKMIQLVLGIPVEELSDINRDVIKFIDVSTSAWYTKYLANAYDVGMLPIPGQDASRFYPERELTRGEAAAMIYNAQRASVQIEREEEEVQHEEEETEQARSTAQEEEEVASVQKIDFPFDMKGKFAERKTVSYNFTLSKRTTLAVEAKLQASDQHEVGCVLHRFTEDGYVYEYYVGIILDGVCSILATLEPGEYQVTLQPGSANATYQVTGAENSGDGNDGFVEAKTMRLNSATTETIAGANFANWYSFTVDGDAGKRLNIELSHSENLLCLIYPLEGVDVYGFSFPQCNQFSTFPKGQYRLGIYRKSGVSGTLTYTVILRD
jgi:hypothetical protein